MANVPLNYKLSFYDPDIPTGVITVQENNANAAVRLDTQFSMQDLVDTVNNSSSTVSMASLATQTPEEIRDNVAPGSFKVIFPIKQSEWEGAGFIRPQYLPSVGGGDGQVLSAKRGTDRMTLGKASIINSTQYTTEQLLGAYSGATTSSAPWLTSNTNGPVVYFPRESQEGNPGAAALVGLWKVTVNVELAVQAINTIGAPISTQLWLAGMHTGNDDDLGNYRDTIDRNSITDNNSPNMRAYMGGHVFETTTSQLVQETDYDTMLGGGWDATKVDKDILVARIKNETIINTQSDNFFEVHITNHGGTGAGPSGSHVVWTGLKALIDYYNFQGSLGNSGMMSVNGVPTFPPYAGGLGLVYTNTVESLANGSGAGAGYLMFEWIGAAEEAPASGYYYDGDAIGEGNL